MAKCIDCGVELTNKTWSAGVRRKRFYICRKCHTKRAAKYYCRHKQEISKQHKKYMKKHHRELRLEVLTHYGGDPPKCACCGEAHIEFLTIDHIYGGGKKHRKALGGGSNFYYWLKKNDFPDGFQVLCWNCNCGIKRGKDLSENLTRDQKRQQRRKMTVLNHYSEGSPKCECCGETDTDCLVLDHIEGGGTKHIKSIGYRLYRWTIKNNFPEGFRVLCYNCNSSLGLYSYCPHQREKK